MSFFRSIIADAQRLRPAEVSAEHGAFDAVAGGAAAAIAAPPAALPYAVAEAPPGTAAVSAALAPSFSSTTLEGGAFAASEPARPARRNQAQAETRPAAPPSGAEADSAAGPVRAAGGDAPHAASGKNAPGLSASPAPSAPEQTGTGAVGDHGVGPRGILPAEPQRGFEPARELLPRSAAEQPRPFPVAAGTADAVRIADETIMPPEDVSLTGTAVMHGAGDGTGRLRRSGMADHSTQGPLSSRLIPHPSPNAKGPARAEPVAAHVPLGPLPESSMPGAAEPVGAAAKLEQARDQRAPSRSQAWAASSPRAGSASFTDGAEPEASSIAAAPRGAEGESSPTPELPRTRAVERPAALSAAPADGAAQGPAQTMRRSPPGAPARREASAPSVRIGQIDIVVEAPQPAPATSAPSMPIGDPLSRHYLRGL